KALYRIYLVLAHEKLEPFGVLVHYLRLALPHRIPFQFSCTPAFDSIFGSILEVVPEFSVKQQRLGWNAANMQASATEIGVFLDQCGFQAILPCADCGGVSGGAAAYDG